MQVVPYRKLKRLQYNNINAHELVPEQYSNAANVNIKMQSEHTTIQHNNINAHDLVPAKNSNASMQSLLFDICYS